MTIGRENYSDVEWIDRGLIKCMDSLLDLLEQCEKQTETIYAQLDETEKLRVAILRDIEAIDRHARH